MSMKTRAYAIVIILILSFVSLPTMSMAEGNEARNPPVIKIGFLNDATGPIAVYAAGFTAASQIALTEINVLQNTYDFEIVYADSACDGQAAATAAQTLVDAGVVGVVGAACSGASMGANAVLSAAGIPQISYASTSPALSDASVYPDFFRVVPSDALQGQALSAVVQADMPADGTVGLIHMTNDYGAGLADSFTADFAAAGHTLCTTIGYEQTTTDFSAAVQAMVDGGCTSAVLASYSSGGGMILDEMASQGWSGQVYGGDGIADEGLAADTSASVDGVIATKPRLNVATSVNSNFASACSNNSDCASGIYTAEAYDAVMLMFDSYLSMSSNDVLNQQISLTGQYWEGASGYITFLENGDSLGAGYDICIFEEVGGSVSLNCYDTWGSSGPPPDTDGDGWSDNDEIDCSTNLNDNSSIPEDWDSDGICDNLDSDNDNDGWSDLDENSCGTGPYNNYSLPSDWDSDGICDIMDWDDDNDGVDDGDDWAPFNNLESSDTDGDSLGDNEDTDDDGDSWTDMDEILCQSDPINSTSVPSDYDSDGECDFQDSDSDNDGYLDWEDACPYNFYDWNDFDNDGLCDNLDTDDDGDGFEDSSDDFPLNPYEWLDTDDDGIGNNYDLDDDNDGFRDNAELYCISDSLDSNSLPIDTDGDGFCNPLDDDDDGDGFLDDSDSFPIDSSEWEDYDNDRIGNNADLDDDNDNWSDVNEINCMSQPLDSSSIPDDNDGDLICDLIDEDDDNDGIEDIVDWDSLNSQEWLDSDGDGMGDNEDEDDDNDMLSDIIELQIGTDPFNKDTDNDGYFDSIDNLPLDSSEWLDSDGDGVGDNSDAFSSIARYQDSSDLVIDAILIFAIFGGGYSLFSNSKKKDEEY